MKNGFTLIELLAVLVIMGVISAIAIPAYTTISISLKESTYESKLKVVKSAVEDWAYDNKNVCSEEIGSITIRYLIINDYLEADDLTGTYTDPRDDTDITGYLVTELKLNDSYYITSSDICANYK